MTIEKTVKSYLSALEKKLNNFYLDIGKNIVDDIPFNEDEAVNIARTAEAQIVILRQILEESEER